MFEKTQSDIVKKEEPMVPIIEKEKLRIPGIKTLHTEPAQHIAEVLAMVIRSRAHILELNWVLGDYIELTYSSK